VSDISLTTVRHQGEDVTLGRNVALKLLLEKSAPNERAGVWHRRLNLALKSRLRTERI
jgi:hypothetical protein